MMSNLNLIFFFILLLFWGCDQNSESFVCDDNPVTPQTLTILTLGDSRVEGDPSGEEYESYRYYLWSTFQEQNWDVDFVGTRRSNREYSNVNGRCFDQDHEGTGGEVTSGILNTIEREQFSPTPKIALLGIGGNDLLDGQLPPAPVLDNITLIIEKLQSDYPGIVVYVEQIAPARSDLMSAELEAILTTFNQGILEVAATTNTPENPVEAVNMSTNWSDQYMADNVHYNQRGAEVVANLYFNAINRRFDP